MRVHNNFKSKYLIMEQKVLYFIALTLRRTHITTKNIQKNIPSIIGIIHLKITKETWMKTNCSHILDIIQAVL